MENMINFTTALAVWVVIIAYLIILIDKVRKTKGPLTLEDLSELAQIIKKQYDALNMTNAKKKDESGTKWQKYKVSL